ncbi:flagellin [Massilia sp. BHUDP2]|uniref:flagellin N-terminal helical domain-containing protein n=1 Tax=Massilia sp. BHUDP2 TaxID=3034505 RepID=UPI001AEB5278
MLSLHTNNAALSAQNSIGRTQSALSTSMTRLSTGYRINSAMDDAAGLQIATRLKSQTSGMAVAMRNTQNSTSMLQTAGGALTEVTNMMIRMKDLATQSADQSSSGADRTAIKAEYDSLASEINNVMTKTTFGGQNLFGTTLAGAMQFQIGASSTETMSLNLGTTHVTPVTNSVTAISAPAVDVSTLAGSTAAIGALTTALDNVGALNSAIGAAANRLEHVYNNLSNISTNVQAATGRIMDVDFAAESANMSSKQMLMQAGTAMLKQSNSMSSMVMSLLQ